MYILLLTLIISSLIVTFLLPRILLLSLKSKILDKQDNRKIHTCEATRLGGASFLPAIFISVVVTRVVSDFLGINGFGANPKNELSIMMCSAMILYYLGLYDDIVGAGYRAKFAIQTLASLMVVLSGCYITDLNGLFGIGLIPIYVGVPLTVVLLIFITNAINLIDGIDGLASMIAAIAFLVYGIIFYMCGEYRCCIYCVASIGVLLPLWYYNVFGLRKNLSTRIFMGDGGTLIIGLILSVMCVTLWNHPLVVEEKLGEVSYLYQIMAFSVLIIPCFDVVRVMICRIRNHKSPFLPDKNHFHHKLLKFGLSPHKSLFVLFLINTLFLSINSLFAIVSLDINIIVLIDIILWVTIHQALSYKINRNI
ncbi:MAG: MraY family glycosyltransferase [Rikenellaceae bacterium]